MNKIDQAFTEIDRRNFLPPALRPYADADQPLPIGFDQTNSQPTTVRMMLQWLDVQPGDRVLDVGSGSGWTTALLAYLTGSKGKVYAVERIPELVEFGRSNCLRLGLRNVTFCTAKDVIGLPGHGPYDRILVSAGATSLPSELPDQLKNGGKMVIPVGYDVLEITKTKEGALSTSRHPGFSFVPLVGSK